MAIENTDHAVTTAVVCVECQNGVLGKDSVLPALAADAAPLVTSISRLLTGARDSGARVLHATYEGSRGAEQPGTARIWRALGPATARWSPGSFETQVLAELFDAADLVVPRHHGLFPTLDTELLPILRGLGIRTVILAGVSLNLALPFTAGHVSQSGFDLVIPRDAVGATPQEYAEQVLTHSLSMLGKVCTVDDILGGWTGRAN